MRLFFILLSLFLLSGCIPPSQDQLRMEMDLAEMKHRLAQLEVQNVETSQSKIAGGDTLQRQTAELQAGVDNLRVELQSVNGRMDDLGHDNKALTDELQVIKDDINLQLTSLTNRVADLEDQVANPKTPVLQQKSPEQKQEPELTAEQLYQNALDAIRNQKNFSAGRKMLEEFANKYPQHELYVNALYWIGEAYYGEKEYESAILQFQDVISKYSSHPKAAAAMLKQALAFNALGDSENAKTTMQKVIAEYPDSTQATAAKKYLEK